jgi:ABC-2 type transport system ATP-binding protein
MTAVAVKIQNLSVVLGDKVKALKNVDAALVEGKITGFIGPSGAGKTTLIRSIVGRQKITRGVVTVLGLPAGSSQLRRQLSYMTQENSVYADLTVRQNLNYFATMFGVKRNQLKSQVAEILKTVDMADQADQLVSQLSSGQKQRVSLAAALIGSPKLMVLDEPTIGLDPVLREQLWILFRRLADQGATLIVSSHVMDEASRCDDLLLLRGGKVLAHGSPQGLCQQTGTRSVEQSFLKLVGEKS